QHFEFKSARMREPYVLLSKALLESRVPNFESREVFHPKRKRSFGHAECRGLDLPRAFPAGLPAVREARHHGTGLDIRVGVVEVVNGNLAVHQDGLFRHAKTHNSREEIDILLRSARAEGDVVIAG